MPKPEYRRHKGGQSFADFRSHNAICIDTPREPSHEPSGMGLTDYEGMQPWLGPTGIEEARETFIALVPDRYKVKG